MRNEYIVSTCEHVHTTFMFILNEKNEDLQIEVTGQMIVDSDKAAFLYLVEEKGMYSYIRFPQSVWPQLVAVLKDARDPSIRLSRGPVVLVDFVEELQALLFNIEGNSNYGDEFVGAVEEIFAEIFTENEV